MGIIFTAETSQISYQPSATSLFGNHFNLLVDHLTCEAVDRYVHPKPLLAVHDEAIPETCSVWRIATALSNYIN
jgi:hypothetical protein